jgi:hypothetical protein
MTAEIILFPTARHVMVEKVARKFVKQADDKADEGIKEVAVRIIRRWYRIGADEDTAVRNGSDFYRAVWARIVVLRHTKLEAGA